MRPSCADRRDGVSIGAQRALAITQTRSGIAEHEVRLVRPEEQRLRTPRVIARVAPSFARTASPGEERLVADEAPHGEHAQRRRDADDSASRLPGA